MICQFLPLFERDCALTFKITLVTNQNTRDVISCVFFYFYHPVLNSLEGISVSDVVRNNNTVSTFVVAGSDSLEALLTSGIPNLQFDSLAVNLIVSDFEINPDCWHECVSE